MKYDVSVTRVTYYTVETAGDQERAVDLVLGALELEAGESVEEVGAETTGHVVELAHVHAYARPDYCGARVCDECGDHQGLERCFCGWSRSGGDGRRELVEMGETIDGEDD